MTVAKKTTKRKSKGKQHPLHAETLDKLAEKLDKNYALISGHELSRFLREEAKRVRGILR